MAGRNIVGGVSPYLGGSVSGWMASGYGSEVQGIGETPLWALYLGLCYFLSAGQPFIFNLLSKMPIVAANVSLAYFAFAKRARGWRFYLFNIYLLVTTVTWGKPDNLATLLAVLALVATDSTSSSAILLSISFMIKPLALVILPAFYSPFKAKSSLCKMKFTIETLVLSAGIFLAPFLIFRWPIKTVTDGFTNWFNQSGALSPLSILTMETGKKQLPAGLWWVGYAVIFGTLALIAYAIMRKPQNTLQFALLSSAVFFTMRPWNSEPNILILLTLFILLKRELPSRWLWVIPMMFAVANSAVQQQFYLLVPTIVAQLSAFYAPFEVYRQWLMVILSIVWVMVLWFNVVSYGNRQRLRRAAINALSGFKTGVSLFSSRRFQSCCDKRELFHNYEHQDG